MKYVSHRNITVASTCGLSVELKKGEPTFCPPQMHAELLALGVIPTEEQPDEVVTLAKNEPAGPAEREAALFKAFESLTLRNKRGDFTTSGAPHSAVLSKEMGWDVGAKERDTAWVKFTSSDDKA